MRVEEIMTRRVITVKPEDTVGTARSQIRSAGIHHLIVMNAEHVVGVLSIRELSSRGDETAVREVMSTRFTTAPPTASVRDVASRMIGTSSGCLPVVDNGKLVGIVTTTDLMHMVTRAAPAQA
jgi:acetoin utilization protein AcuB